MKFYLGTHQVDWLARVDVSLFVSHRRLSRYKELPVAREPWALDSGGFTELTMFGEWRTPPEEYADAVMRYQEDIEQLAFASPQDHMCEPAIIQKTGRSVRAHQHATVDNFLELRQLAPDVPWIPVLQGWKPREYHECVDLYGDAGVDLFAFETVGIGSVCRRQGTATTEGLLRDLAGSGLKLHGYGVKGAGLARYGECLASADSMAWSFAARYDDPLPGCTHKRCSSCMKYALRWRERLV